MPPAHYEPTAPDPTFPRYSDQPLPPYRFVPSLNPHPVNDPAGHLFNTTPPPPAPEAAALLTDWRLSPTFRLGVDLYNYAYWWEAHETWEALWRCYPLDAPARHALQVLIQVSACQLVRHMNHPDGVARLLERIAGHVALATAADRPIWFGVKLPAWIDTDVRPWFLHESTTFPFLRPT